MSQALHLRISTSKILGSSKMYSRLLTEFLKSKVFGLRLLRYFNKYQSRGLIYQITT